MNFPDALAKVRVQHAKRQAALVVHTDVDNTHANGLTVQQRKREIETECGEAKVTQSTASDPVASLIARREIETWIQFLLSGTSVDEHTQYPKLTGCEADCWPAAEAFACYARGEQLPAQAPPSLADGIAEFAKVI